MCHLTDEQLEEFLGEAVEPAGHLAGCADCLHRLEELRAVRRRLKQTFAAIRAPAGLVERIVGACRGEDRQGVAQAAGVGSTAEGGCATFVQTRKRFRRFTYAAAAAVLVMLVGLSVAMHINSTKEAQAARQELVSIHLENLAEADSFTSSNDPAELARYFKDNLGFVPRLPKVNQGLAIRSCCLAKFRGQIAGSYVVNTPHGKISIIVVGAEPAKLGLSGSAAAGGRQIGTGSFATNNLAAVRLGEYTYCAVGEVPAEQLVELLGLLVSQ